MDTALNLPNSTAVATPSTPVVDRAITTKVTPIDASDKATTRPSERPFVAQVVSARLSGAAFPANPGEITPPERTLRPYDVPMLPSREDADAPKSGPDVTQDDQSGPPDANG